MEAILIPGILLLIVLFIGSALFSAVETSLIAISQHRLRRLQEKNPSKAAYIERWIKDPSHVLTTILIGINLLNIASAIVAENLISVFVHERGLPEWIAPVLSVGVVSLVVIEFCEIIPKIMAYHNSEKYAVRLIKPLFILNSIVQPLTRGMVGLGNIIIRLTGGKPGSPQGAFVSQAEILSMVDRGEKQGIIEKDEQEMIHSIFELGETQVKEVMVPRPDVDFAPATYTVAEMAQFIEEVNHSRIPIYEKTKDNILGIVNSKTLLAALKEGKDNDPVRSLIVHKTHFVPESKMVDELLHEFQTLRIHMAIVVDEYGSVAGVVTLEDLLEEIVGEIRDEYDTEEPLYRWLNSETLRVNARIDITELNEILEEELPDEEAYESLGGLIFHRLGKVPKTGETLVVDDYQMIVEKMTGRRIASVIIKKIHKEEVPEEQNGNGVK